MIGVWRQQLKMLCLSAGSGCRPAVGGMFCRRENRATYSSGIEASKYMQKLLTRKGAKTKRKWYQPHIAQPLELSDKREQPNKHGVSQAQGHRARQLSHVLYVKICQIANSGELHDEIVNKQVLFTQVKMHPTFSGINVYWDAKRADSAEIETLLMGLSGKLRSLLISYHVLGRIPTITFVKDRSKRDLGRLNQLFEIADYGPDYFPSTGKDVENLHLGVDGEISARFARLLTHERTTETHPHQVLSPSNPEQGLDMQGSDKHLADFLGRLSFEAERESENKVSSSSLDAQNKSEEPFSNFRSDVYGLPRDDLMKKVMAKKKKVKHQPVSTCDSTVLPTSGSQIKDYAQLRNKITEKEKLMRQRDSTKVKQRLLQQEFDEVLGPLYDDVADDMK